MVLSQIELRSSTAPTTLTPPTEKKDKANKKSSTITRYVEGESDCSNEDTNVVVEIEHGDADAIEDIELDGGSEEDDDDNMSSESEDDEEGVHNSFIDDEAEEEYSDEENDDSE